MPKILFILLDGAADVGENTPLHAAAKPNLDRLSRNSLCGVWPGPQVPPGYNLRSLSELATLELLGYRPEESPGRGPLEALGAGLKLRKNAVYLRANFATAGKEMKTKGVRIIDRRAGRDETGLDGLAKLLSMRIGGFGFKFYRTLGHRGVLEISGKAADAMISDGDQGNAALPIAALDKKAVKTAEAVNVWLEKAHAALSAHAVNKRRKFPANYILLRGAGSPRKIEAFAKRWGVKAACVAADGMVKGVAAYFGMDVLEVPGATGDANTDIKGKLQTAVGAFRKYDFVLLHIKGMDVCSHAKDFEAKKRFAEKLDRELFGHISEHRELHIVVTADHITDSKTGEHVLGPVPFIIYSPEAEVTGAKAFDEVCCRAVGIVKPMERLILEIRRER
jgi:2,3-bisphosphoglycerate-independent phosphoglycerate mutase